MPRTQTAEMLDLLIEPGTWQDWDEAGGPSPSGPSGGDSARAAIPADYAQDLALARERSGGSESIRTGAARVGGHAVAIVAGDFDFLAGSIGRESADRILAAFDRATLQGMPVLGLPTSGGTRMQEGTPTFLLMAALAGAVMRHRAAGLAYLVYLRHPTTGGVFASWGSLGQVSHGEPGALVGFLGPRVYEGLHGEAFPPGVQTSEGLTDAGVIDGVCPPRQWRETVVRLLTAWRARPDAGPPGSAPGRTDPGGRDQDSRSQPDRVTEPPQVSRGAGVGLDAWECVRRSRAPQRPGLWELMAFAEGHEELKGTHAGESAAATRLFVTRFGGCGCVLVGQDRAAEARSELIGPADLRLARRGQRLAEQWRLPLISVIDTQGAELSAAAESRALAGEIARCLADLSQLRVPTISLLLGGGGGGAALALLPADRVLAARDSWITPLPPEGASLIRYRTTDMAPDIARAQSITATDLHRVGAVDVVVPSPDDRSGQAVIAGALGRELARAPGTTVDLDARSSRWSAVGEA